MPQPSPISWQPQVNPGDPAADDLAPKFVCWSPGRRLPGPNRPRADLQLGRPSGRGQLLDPPVARLPGRPGALTLPAPANPPVTADELLAAWPDLAIADCQPLVPLSALVPPGLLGRQPYQMMPADPDSVVFLLNERISESRTPEARRALEAMLGGLRAGIAASPRCGRAARAYLPHYDRPDSAERRAAASNYDRDCLGAFLARIGAAMENEPAVFRRGGRTGSVEGALSATVLLELGGQFFCAGLLRPDATVLTARHCFTGEVMTGMAAGNVRAWRMNGPGGPWPVRSLGRNSESNAELVRGDWVVALLEAEEPPPVPRVELVDLAVRAAVTVAAFFSDHAVIGYQPPAVLPPHQLGVRWPRAGFCLAMEQRIGCLHLACQTVPGFSGAPIFLLDDHDSDVPLKVVGLVSRPQSSEHGCGTSEGQITMAVAATEAR